MINIGEQIDSEVKQYDSLKLIDIIANNCNVSKEKINKILVDNTILVRDDFLSVPAPFKKSDVYPWRNNRKLSFVRRPLISYNNTIIWGNRQLYHSLRFTLELIENGKFEAVSILMKQLVSKFSNYVGNEFNISVSKKIKQLGFSKVYTKVKKINQKRITDENSNTLGDIDVIIINESKRKIIVAEVKAFSFSRTPYEINREYINLFCDSKNKLSYISKHKRRVSWIKNHIEDVKIQYCLPNGQWKIEDILIVNEPIVSNKFYHKKQKIIVYSEIDYNRINNI